MKKSTLLPILCLLTASLLCACARSLPDLTNPNPRETTTGHTHTPGEMKTVTEATKDKDGLKQQVCTDCGEILQTESIPAIGSAGLAYEINADGKTCTITGIGTCTDKALVIGQINSDGYTVTAIGENAFQNCTSLTSVQLPASITRIDSRAFLRCENLTKINFPDGLVEIGNTAFFGCYKLASVVLPDSVTTIGGSAFTDCHAMKTLRISPNLQTIPTGAFSVCTGITTITVPEGVEEIEASAFNYCESATKIVLPTTLRFIGARSFSECFSLKEIVFQGTKAQWEAIEKEENWMDFGACTIRCTDGEI